MAAPALTVRHALQRVGGKPTLVEPKTPRSQRTIRLPASLVAALEAHRERQERDRLLAGERWREWGLVFASRVGTPLDARDLLRHYKAALERAGLPDVRWHDLRHTAATLMVTKGVPPRVVMDVLGTARSG